MSDNDKICFVIAPIGEPESETRRRSDQILTHVIRPAVEPHGYKAIRADEIDQPGIITNQVIQHVVNDPLVIADLTERNPNVFYELAIRHAMRKPFIQLIDKNESIPFDVAPIRIIHIDHHDLDSVAEAKTKIREQIKALSSDPSDLETPISTALELQDLRQSENPEKRSLADLVSVMSDIRERISNLEEALLSGRVSPINMSTIRYLEDRLSKEIDKSISRHRGLNPTRPRTNLFPYPEPERSDEYGREASDEDSLPW